MANRQLTLTPTKGAKSTYYQKLKQIFGTSIIGYWPCWDLSGGAATELVNGYHGKYAECTLAQQGIGDGKTSILLQNGTTAKLDVSAAAIQAAFNAAAGAAIFWFKMPNAALWADSNTYPFFQAQADSTNRIYFRKNSDLSVTGVYYATTLKSINIQQQCSIRWIQYAFVWDKLVSDSIYIYMNGIKTYISTTTLGTFAGALAAGYPQFGSVPSNIAHAIILNAVPTAVQVYDSFRYLPTTLPVRIVFDGDSRTQKSWPLKAVDDAFPSGALAYGGRSVANRALSGATTDTIIANAATGVDTLVNSKCTNVLVVWIGVNSNANHTAQQIYDDIHTYCEARTAAGWNKIIVCTEIDAGQANWSTKYIDLNNLLKGDSHFATALADLGAKTELQTNTDLTYFDADTVHLTAAGYAVVEGVVEAALAGLNI